jgi:hypothetical protein
MKIVRKATVEEVKRCFLVSDVLSYTCKGYVQFVNYFRILDYFLSFAS